MKKVYDVKLGKGSYVLTKSDSKKSHRLRLLGILGDPGVQPPVYRKYREKSSLGELLSPVLY